MIYKILTIINLIAVISLAILFVSQVFEIDDLKSDFDGMESTCYLIARA